MLAVPIEGQDSLARELVELHTIGWRNFHVVLCHRFIGNGLGMKPMMYASMFTVVSRHLGSGNDGMTIHMHGNGQDQIGQIHKRGTTVVHGDVGQCYGYGAKGGKLFIRGNAAGRPMINSVGSQNWSSMELRLIISRNPSWLEPLKVEDLLSSMELNTMKSPSIMKHLIQGNLFSLSSGGAIYVRDPHSRLSVSQLNGGDFTELTDADWQILEPLLMENEEHFGIQLAALLTVEGEVRAPEAVYRKIIPLKNKALSVEDGWGQARLKNRAVKMARLTHLHAQVRKLNEMASHSETSPYAAKVMNPIVAMGSHHVLNVASLQ